MRLPASFDEPLGGRYRVETQVGAGATGVVYRAFDLETGRPVALKVLSAELDQEDNPAVREADLLRHVAHPGVIRIFDAGVLPDFGLPFLAMEWLEGQDLGSHQRNAPLTIREATALGILVARALGSAHASGVVHRDIKPANIVLRRRVSDPSLVPELEFEPVLVDFGIAGRKGSGDLGGTPAYMSPEQARGSALVDHRSDLYSLGATLFELLVGRPPHQGPSPIATLARIATTPAPRASTFRADLPPALDDTLEALLETEPASRPQSAADVELALLHSLDDDAHRSIFPEDPSSRHGSRTTRLVTTLVALGLPDLESQTAAVSELTERGAAAAPLGKDAIVAHLGVEKATGGEAQIALELARRIAARNTRVGIASGRARLAPGGGRVLPVGEVVDRAATLARSAAPLQVLADATTAELGRGRHEFQMRADGSAVVGPLVSSSRPERTGGAPFVGREAELGQILAAYERATSGSGSLVVTVTGPPGIGKSRLQKETVARIAARDDDAHIIVRRSDAYGQRHVLGTAADILRSLLELRKGASHAEVSAALAERIGPQTLSQLSADNQRLLSILLGGDQLPDASSPNATRDALWLAMTDLLLQTLSNETVVLVMEDLQWADSESIAWLDHLLGRSSRHPLVLVACVRPSFWDDHPSRFGSRDLVKIDLRPISARAVRAIAEALLGENGTSEQIDAIVTQAGGSPLFAEELARLSATGRSAESAPTIEAAIQVSLDALTPDCRDAVVRLSVFGQTCWNEGLRALGIDEPEGLMKKLAAQEVVQEQATSRFEGSTEYVFKHALVHDVAYSLLDEQYRSELHALAGDFLAKMGEDSATVARHLDLGEQHERAAAHWAIAARRALRANALGDALSMAERSLSFAETNEESFARASLLDEAWTRLDPRAADRETAVSAMTQHAFDEPSRVRALGARARYDDARGAHDEVISRLMGVLVESDRLGLPDEVARCSATLASRAAFAGDLEMAETEAARLLDPALASERGARVDAYQTLAIVHQARAQLMAAIESRRSAAHAAREAGLKERESMLTANLGFALSNVGARKEGREALEAGLSLAETIGSPGAARHAQMNLLGWGSLYGSDRRLDAFLGDTRAEADEAASGYWSPADRSNLGILFYRGVELLRVPQESSLVRARALLRLCVQNYRELGHRDVLPVALGMLAEAERLLGALDEAERIGSEGATLLEAGAPSLLNEAPVFLSLYKTRAARGDEPGADEALSQGIRPLVRRTLGLVGSPYARRFLTELPHNAELVAATERAGFLPDALHRVLSGERHD